VQYVNASGPIPPSGSSFVTAAVFPTLKTQIDFSLVLLSSCILSCILRILAMSNLDPSKPPGEENPSAEKEDGVTTSNVVEWEREDPENPRNWPVGIKSGLPSSWACLRPVGVLDRASLRRRGRRVCGQSHRTVPYNRRQAVSSTSHLIKWSLASPLLRCRCRCRCRYMSSSPYVGRIH
jgi:hypothetical protein